MAIDDRERNFEKALSRELRGGEAGGLVCPDAEMLAAYHDRMLSPEEMGALKSHIAACPSCQEILGTLEVSEAIPVEAEDSERVVALRVAAAPAGAKSASVREIPKPKTKAYLRWAVPAGAIAAGLLVWVAVHSDRAAYMKTAPRPVQVAENREAANQQLATPKQLPAEPLDNKASVRSEDLEFGRAKEELDAAKPNAPSPVTRAKAGGAAGAYDHGPRVLQNQVQNQIQNNGQLSDRNQSAGLKRLDEIPITGRDTASLALNAPRQDAAAKKAASPAPPPPAPSSAVGGATGAASGSGSGAGADASKDVRIGSTSQVVEVQTESAYVANEKKEDADKAAALSKLKGQMSRVQASTAGNLRELAGSPAFVGSPNPKVFWYFTPAGVLLHSEDGGKTTKQQNAGEGLKFLAGSAPNAKTCWLLAEKGIVVRTTDGGKKWKSSQAPANQSFTMITAIDTKHALVTDAVARVSYSTSDGGGTWKVVPQP